ncbi:TRAP transporter small permease subunit [Candidatus Vondammii sp. HM_W22]|uniref:TRAP transporter small permease subunit n=1 Tax=Candidatus Vondammii sp. HM_W22 TaxID=2687299 RepID=UPI001F13B664|nr:TRAP transporter small permease subunit [Candidatus Vondammii sp. HM_W22]
MSQTIGLDFSSNSYIEAQWYMFSLIFLLGAGYTLRNKGHVRVDIIYSRVSRRAQTWTNIFDTVTFLMPATLLILWASRSFLADSGDVA